VAPVLSATDVMLTSRLIRNTNTFSFCFSKLPFLRLLQVAGSQIESFWITGATLYTVDILCVSVNAALMGTTDKYLLDVVLS